MSPENIPIETIQFIIEKAKYIPSADNCQSFTFQWDGNQLSVYYDEKRGKHVLNENYHATWLSLGTLIEALKMAASEKKLSINFIIDLENFKIGPVACITFAETSDRADPLAPFIISRCTDRRFYSQKPLDAELVQGILSFNKEFTDSQVYYNGDLTKSICTYFSTAEQYVWTNIETLKDIFSWLRLSEKEITATQDGMTWQSLNVQKKELPIFKLFRKYPGLIKKLWKVGLRKKFYSLAYETMSLSGGLFCATVKNLDNNTLIEAGRIAFRTWVYLNAKGCGVQPMSLGSLLAYDTEKNSAPSFTSPEFKKHFILGKSVLSEYFQLPKEHFPVWAFRVGYVDTPLPQAARTLRLPLADILKVSTVRN